MYRRAVRCLGSVRALRSVDLQEGEKLTNTMRWTKVSLTVCAGRAASRGNCNADGGIVLEYWLNRVSGVERRPAARIELFMHKGRGNAERQALGGLFSLSGDVGAVYED